MVRIVPRWGSIGGLLLLVLVEMVLTTLLATSVALAAETHVLFSEAELEAGLTSALDLTADPAEWKTNEWILKGTFRWDDGAIVLEDGGPDKPRGAHRIVELNQVEPLPVTLAAESKSEDVPGLPDTEYSLWADIRYTDGSPGWGAGIVPFSPGTHDWEYKETTIVPAKPIKSVDVYVLFRRPGKMVWFRNVTLREHQVSGTFDRETVQADAAAEPLDSVPVAANLASGSLLLRLAANGRVLGLESGGQSVTVPGFGGFMIRDVFAGSGYYVGETVVQSNDDTVTLHSQYQTLGVELDATFTPRQDLGYIEVNGAVMDKTGKDRGLTVYFALPVSYEGWTWWDDIARSSPICQGREYSNVTDLVRNPEAGVNGTISIYPLAAISRSQAGIAMALAADAPRLARLGYSAATNLFYVAFDLGLAPETRPASRADFKFYIYGFDGTWGFRAAWDKYMAIESEYFQVRVPRQGIWMPFSPIASIKDWQDFGFAIHELGNIGQTWFAKDHGILAFKYEEAHSFGLPMTEPASDRTYETMMAALERAQEAGTAKAFAAEASVLEDANGWARVFVDQSPWNNGAVFVLNPDPDLPGIDGYPNRGRLAYRPDDEDLAIVDGMYFDSVEVRHWATFLNFRREHFLYTDLPLVYDRSAKKVAILQASSYYEFLRWARQDLRSKGKYMMLNSTPYKFWWFTMLADIAGTEDGWITEDGNWNPPSDRNLAYMRTLSGKKPYELLQNIHFELTDLGFVEKYFQLALFYGIYPSMFSHNAASDPYWENSTLYNRDRDLFKKYIPIITEVASAGWEPITYARVDNDNVRIERYGKGNGQPVYFTAYNFSGARQEEVDLTVELDRVGLSSGCAVRDVLTGEMVATQAAGAEIKIVFNINANAVRVFEILPTSVQ